MRVPQTHLPIEYDALLWVHDTLQLSDDKLLTRTSTSPQHEGPSYCRGALPHATRRNGSAEPTLQDPDPLCDSLALLTKASKSPRMPGTPQMNIP